MSAETARDANGHILGHEVFGVPSVVIAPPAPRAVERPEIVVRKGEIERVASEALEALRGAPNVYQRGQMFVHVTREPPPPSAIKREPGAPRIAPMQPARLRELLSTNARFVVERMRKSGPFPDPIDPPKDTVETIIARPAWPTIPHLVSVTSVPVLRADGTILESKGYDKSTGIYFEPAGEFPRIAARPTLDDAKRAAAKLFDVVADFPFTTGADRAAWLAAVLTPPAKHAFDGCIPLVAIDKNVRGAGAGLLADTIALIATGQAPPRTRYTDDDEELGKLLLAIALEGDPVVLLDNVAATLGTPTMDMVLTARRIRGRVLGITKTANAPFDAMIMATGNNLQMGPDTTRRTLSIRLESSEENPEARDPSTFKHADLLAWVRRNQPDLLAAALTILRAFCIAGRPAQNLPTWGSFEAWSALVRNAVVWLGEPDPAATRTALAERGDDEARTLRMLLSGWREIDKGDLGVTVGQVLETLERDAIEAAKSGRARAYEGLRAALEEIAPPNGKPVSAKSLGKRLARFRGRVIGGLSLDCALDAHAGVQRWKVRDAKRVVDAAAGLAALAGFPHPISRASDPANVSGDTDRHKPATPAKPADDDPERAAIVGEDSP